VTFGPEERASGMMTPPTATSPTPPAPPPGAALARRRLRAVGIDLNADACIACGVCSSACPVADWSEDRLDPRRFVRLINYGLGDLAAVQPWLWQCTTCGRCDHVCPSGIPISRLVAAARAEAPPEADPGPAQIYKTAAMHRETSNNMGITEDDWVETVEWMAEEAEDTVPGLEVPVERQGAELFVTINSKLPMYFPVDLQHIFKIFHASGVSWTLPRAWWEGTNYAMFVEDTATWEATLRAQVERVRSLGCATMAYTECGHGYYATLSGYRRFGIQPGFGVVHVVKLYARWIREGRFTLDPSQNPEPVTLHDPCNAVRKARRAGFPAIDDDLRYVLARVCETVVEPTPTRGHNLCCGGGGGALLAGFKSAREHYGRTKVDQIDRTGASLVCTPCVNCFDALSNLTRSFDSAWRPVHLWTLLARAIVL